MRFGKVVLETDPGPILVSLLLRSWISTVITIEGEVKPLKVKKVRKGNERKDTFRLTDILVV